MFHYYLMGVAIFAFIALVVYGRYGVPHLYEYGCDEEGTSFGIFLCTVSALGLVAAAWAWPVAIPVGLGMLQLKRAANKEKKNNQKKLVTEEIEQIAHEHSLY